MPLRLVPVLDVKAGRAVRAIGGDRDHYQPLRSILHDDSDPIELARAYRDRLGLRELYVADLDAIAGAAPSVALYRDLSALGVDVWVDAGVRDLSSIESLRGSGVSSVVLGLETLRGSAALAEIVRTIGAESLVFSLDLRGGVPITPAGSDWGSADPRSIARSVIALGLHRLILLDLSRVGMGRGMGTLPLLSTLSVDHPDVEFIVGGGVATVADLSAVESAGASALLIGSAFHDGRIRDVDLAFVSSGEGNASAK